MRADRPGLAPAAARRPAGRLVSMSPAACTGRGPGVDGRQFSGLHCPHEVVDDERMGRLVARICSVRNDSAAVPGLYSVGARPAMLPMLAAGISVLTSSTCWPPSGRRTESCDDPCCARGWPAYRSCTHGGRRVSPGLRRNSLMRMIPPPDRRIVAVSLCRVVPMALPGEYMPSRDHGKLCTKPGSCPQVTRIMLTSACSSTWRESRPVPARVALVAVNAKIVAVMCLAVEIGSKSSRRVQLPAEYRRIVAAVFAHSVDEACFPGELGNPLPPRPTTPSAAL